jgi:hypothetical protein
VNTIPHDRLHHLTDLLYLALGADPISTASRQARPFAPQ